MFEQRTKDCIAVLTSGPNFERRCGCLTIKARGSSSLQGAIDLVPCLPCLVVRMQKGISWRQNRGDAGIAAIKKLFPI